MGDLLAIQLLRVLILVHPQALIESRDIIKMGVNISGDGQKLRRDFGIKAQGLLELATLAHHVDEPRLQSLQMRKWIKLDHMVRLYAKRMLNKGPVQISNWEDSLDEEQMECKCGPPFLLTCADAQGTPDASNDAHCALTLLNRLLAIAESNEQTVDLKALTNCTSTPPPRPAVELVAVEDPTADSASHEVEDSSADAAASTSKPRRPVPWSTREPVAASNSPYKPSRIRTYEYWHNDGLEIDHLRAKCRSIAHPLAASTVM